ncbi:hypothetical protein V8F33_002647 [Rhypophila sp. PSN 637]
MFNSIYTHIAVQLFNSNSIEWELERPLLAVFGCWTLTRLLPSNPYHYFCLFIVCQRYLVTLSHGCLHVLMCFLLSFSLCHFDGKGWRFPVVVLCFSVLLSSIFMDSIVLRRPVGGCLHFFWFLLRGLASLALYPAYYFFS